MADYFAQLNNKMGGDLKKIQIVGEYMVEIWKAVGMDMSRVQVPFHLFPGHLLSARKPWPSTQGNTRDATTAARTVNFPSFACGSGYRLIRKFWPSC